MEKCANSNVATTAIGFKAVGEALVMNGMPKAGAIFQKMM